MTTPTIIAVELSTEGQETVIVELIGFKMEVPEVELVLTFTVGVFTVGRTGTADVGTISTIDQSIIR